MLILVVAVGVVSVNEASSPEGEVRVAFVGDMMFDRYIRSVAERDGYPSILKGAEPLFERNDVVVGNLEGPVGPFDSMSKESVVGSRANMTFIFDPVVAGVLATHNIGIVNIGNNHILDYGRTGLETTRKHLGEMNIAFFGDPIAREYTTHIYEYDNVKIGFANYNDFDGRLVSATLADIPRLKKNADFVVVYAHWGDEYKKNTSSRIRSLAHTFINAGADLIIGSHPHVIQEEEVYKGVPIYYSLGNFVFDQYFSEMVKVGRVVEVTIDKTGDIIRHSTSTVRMSEDGKTTLQED